MRRTCITVWGAQSASRTGSIITYYKNNAEALHSSFTSLFDTRDNFDVVRVLCLHSDMLLSVLAVDPVV